MTVRRQCCLMIAALSLAASARTAPADDSIPGDQRRFVTPEMERVVADGLQWLSTRQMEDGSFRSITEFGGNPGVVGLCGLSFLASGSTPGRGPYGHSIDRCLDYILQCSQTDGYIVEPRPDYYQGPMYGHGFAALFLAEVYGETNRDDVRGALERAVKLIVDSQNREGGWRYLPETKDADISVTVCQVMALRAARNAGLAVPKETISLAVDYIRRSQNPDGGFKYQLQRAAESMFARSAAALVGLYNCGVHEGPVIDNGIAYLLQFQPGRPGTRHQAFYFYGHYYAAQAAWHAGGDAWETWFPAIRDELIQLRSTDGSWPDAAHGREYATAMALLVLQTPKGYLPIFQR